MGAAPTVGCVRIEFTKLSDARHRVGVRRSDGSIDTVELDSRSFLHHDLAHFAVESELGLASGVWGSVEQGGRLDGVGLDGDDMELAETISGPMQTMLRTRANATEIGAVLERIVPDLASDDLAHRLHERFRALAGHWASTRYGDTMVLVWGADDGHD